MKSFIVDFKMDSELNSVPQNGSLRDTHTHTHSYCMVERMNFMLNYERFSFFLNWFSAQWDSCEMGHNAILLDDCTSSNYVFVMTGSDCKSAIKSKITERIPTETNLFGDFCAITNSLCQAHHTPLAETARVLSWNTLHLNQTETK